MSSDEKVKLQVYITERLDRDFRSFIAKRYQTFEKGLLSHEAELALGHWMSLHTNTQNYEVKPPNPQPKIGMYYLQMKNWLLASLYQQLPPGSIIPTTHLERALQNTRGYDKRTIVKWKRVFVENKLIKILGSNQWELVA